MPDIQANGLTFHYESRGPESEGTPVILMVMGLGVQMILWPEPLLDMLVQQGFRVIRFDNRDVGLSSHLDHLRVPNIALEVTKFFLHIPVKAPYLIDDMADDTAALIDALNLGRPHVVGASMGGMIGQSLAAIPTETGEPHLDHVHHRPPQFAATDLARPPRVAGRAGEARRHGSRHTAHDARALGDCEPNPSAGCRASA